MRRGDVRDRGSVREPQREEAVALGSGGGAGEGVGGGVRHPSWEAAPGGRRHGGGDARWSRVRRRQQAQDVAHLHR